MFQSIYSECWALVLKWRHQAGSGPDFLSPGETSADVFPLVASSSPASAAPSSACLIPACKKEKHRSRLATVTGKRARIEAQAATRVAAPAVTARLVRARIARSTDNQSTFFIWRVKLWNKTLLAVPTVSQSINVCKKDTETYCIHWMRVNARDETFSRNYEIRSALWVGVPILPSMSSMK